MMIYVDDMDADYGRMKLSHMFSDTSVEELHAMADAIGIQKSLMSHVILVVITIGIALLLPSEREMERYSAAQAPVAEPLTPSVVT